MQIGGEFAPHPYPSAWGTNPSFAQISSFWANPSTSQPYYAAATQGGQAYQLPYTSSPADPFLFYTTIPFNASLLGSWNINQISNCYSSNAGSCNTYSVSFKTNNIQSLSSYVSNPPAQPPVVQNLAVDGLSTTPTVTWSIPSSVSSLTSSGFTIGTQFLIFDASKNNKYIDFYHFNGPVTSLNLADLPSTSSTPGGPLTIPMTVGDKYVLSVVLEVDDSRGTNVFQSRSYASFAPSAISAPFPGPVYVPNVSREGGATTYTFDMSVDGGVSYNLDPTAVERSVYQIGAGNPNFASVELPGGANQGDYALYLWEGGKWVFDAYLAPNTVFDFGGGGVSQFKILDFDAPAEPSDFVTRVTFEGDGTFTGAITTSAPEPSTWAMALLGFAGLGLVGRRAAPASARA